MAKLLFDPFALTDRRRFLVGTSTLAAAALNGTAQSNAEPEASTKRKAYSDGHQVREACRSGELSGQTSGLAPGFSQPIS